MLTDTIELDADASDEIRRCAEEMNLPAEGMALCTAVRKPSSGAPAFVPARAA